MIFVFVISYYMAVLDAIPSREGERFLKKKWMWPKHFHLIDVECGQYNYKATMIAFAVCNKEPRAMHYGWLRGGSKTPMFRILSFLKKEYFLFSEIFIAFYLAVGCVENDVKYDTGDTQDGKDHFFHNIQEDL